MVSEEKLINAFASLGNQLNDMLSWGLSNEISIINDACIKATQNNIWFTEDNIRLALSNISGFLNIEKLTNWLKAYPCVPHEPLMVGVVMAGNIPLVGFHDFLCVLLSGNRFLGKLSHDDRFLLPALAEILINIEPEFKSLITFTTGKLQGFDAIIATGSNNSSRYFDYYFNQYPHIIRHNRNGVAVLCGNENEADLRLLSSDVFSYFGLGCRSVSMFFVPQGFDFLPLLKVFAEKNELMTNNAHYFHNYEYNKAVWLVNGEKYFDNGGVLLKEGSEYGSPVAVVHFQYYNDLTQLEEKLAADADKIQCVVCKNASLPYSFKFGETQSPQLNDYADGVDTMKFLSNLQETTNTTKSII